MILEHVLERELFLQKGGAGMKKWKDIMKSKGIYIVSLFGTITILAMAAIAMNLMEGSTKDGSEIDLNETPGIVSEQNENKELVKEPMNHEMQTDENLKDEQEVTVGQSEEQKEVAGKDALLQHESVGQVGTNVQENLSENVTFSDKSEIEENTRSLAEQELTEQSEVTLSDEQLLEQEDSLAQAEEMEQTEETQEVSGMNPDTVIRGLSFQPEQGMAWPMNGAVVLNYSMDHAIYHATLDSYRTSDCILISGEEGMPICAAVKGVVTDVSEDRKTGTTVTMRISEEFSIRYGQLATVTVKVGDVVEQGKQFAVLGKPSKHYTKEGSCLYVQVLKGETPVNPMLYFKDGE